MASEAAEATISATPVEEPASPTAPPVEKATPTASPGAGTPLQATEPAASPSPAVPPAPHVDVGQAPYAASDCSDKYPCDDDWAGWEARMRVPPGFEIEAFAQVEGQPTSITFGPEGLLYVSTMTGDIFTVDQDGEVELFLEGFDTPTGLAFRPGTDELYVSNRVLNENSGGEAQISVVRDGEVSQLFGDIPCCYTYLHAANGIAFGPDGYGYVPVGARADHGEILPGNPREGEQDTLQPWEATILRFSPDGQEVAPYAFGLRNAYDLAWDDQGRLFATDNAPDFGPPDELHLVEPGGQHGYPWYDCDVCFPAPSNVEIVPPLTTFVPHAAVAGITAYLGEAFPGYHGDLFVALWSAFEGAQKVVRISPDSAESSAFATGFAAPIDVTVGPEGRLYVADWATGIVFRIQHVNQS